MGLGTLIMAVALAIVAGVIIALPLFERKTPALAAPTHLEQLEAERTASVRAIRELDEDFRTGKIGEADYAALRPALVQRGANALRELDGLTPALGVVETSASARGAQKNNDIDTQIEAQVLALRKRTAACPKCGKPIAKEDKFCASCGAKIS